LIDSLVGLREKMGCWEP